MRRQMVFPTELNVEPIVNLRIIYIGKMIFIVFWKQPLHMGHCALSWFLLWSPGHVLHSDKMQSIKMNIPWNCYFIWVIYRYIFYVNGCCLFAWVMPKLKKGVDTAESFWYHWNRDTLKVKLGVFWGSAKALAPAKLTDLHHCWKPWSARVAVVQLT